MHHLTVAVGVILTAIGLFGYFWSAKENPSLTALIPAGFGVVLIVLGIIAHRASARKHSMHAAAAIALIGFLAAVGRLVAKLADVITDDPTVDKRPVRLTALMALVCLVYVGLCVGSFISARRRRTGTTGD